MQGWFDSAQAALRLLLMLVLGWTAIFLVTRILEQRLDRKRPRRGPSSLDALGWLWSYSNVIGIPTLILGAAYLIWSMNSGTGLGGGPTMLVILLMTGAGFLVGFGPSLRR